MTIPTILESGDLKFSDNTTLNSATIPWGNISSKPSFFTPGSRSVAATGVYPGNEPEISRGIHSGVTNGNCGHGNSPNCRVADAAHGLNKTEPIFYLDNSSWDSYYYHDNCDCDTACDCGGGGKIICTKLYELDLLPTEIYEADQEFGKWLVEKHPDVYNGYRAWAEIVVDAMNGNSIDIMPWSSDKDNNRKQIQTLVIRWAKDIATPWAEEIAFRTGKTDTKNITGKILFWIGVPVCKTIGMWRRIFGPSIKPAGVAKGVLLISFFAFLRGVVCISNLLTSKSGSN